MRRLMVVAMLGFGLACTGFMGEGEEAGGELVSPWTEIPGFPIEGGVIGYCTNKVCNVRHEDVGKRSKLTRDYGGVFTGAGYKPVWKNDDGTEAKFQRKRETVKLSQHDQSGDAVDIVVTVEP
jgi:hypothetical protein